ncbi:MAG: class I SAM-dependent methyltransferase [Bacteroidales bacterium]|jgi:SAM-dependent methyltransferase
MDSSLEIQGSDPVGAVTLSHISEAEAFNKWMYSTISPYLNGRILEIGSGIGNISEFLLKDKSNVTLSDLRPEYCDFLLNHFHGKNSLEGVVTIDLAEKDFDGVYGKILESFDSVFALNVIEHIENDFLAVRNCMKLLKKGGMLVLLVPSYHWLYCRFDEELGHFRRYNRKSLRDLMALNGFIIENLFNFNAAGVFGWFLFGKLLNNKQIKQGQMKLYNIFVSLFSMIDKILFHKLGLSLIIAARK